MAARAAQIAHDFLACTARQVARMSVWPSPGKVAASGCGPRRIEAAARRPQHIGTGPRNDDGFTVHVGVAILGDSGTTMRAPDVPAFDNAPQRA